MLKIYRVLGKKEELQFPMKSASESDLDTTMFYLSHCRMTARYLSGEKNLRQLQGIRRRFRGEFHP